MSRLSTRPLPLIGVLLLALALRIWGLAWGLPSATHYFSYHPDESVVLETSSVTMNALAGRLLPHFYNYGSLQLYLVCFANTLAALFGAVDVVPKNFSLWYPQWAKMYLIGRLLTVGMGVGTVWVTYAIGRRLWGERASLLAALALVLMPLHAQHSHFLTVDVPATFWATLSLLWVVRLVTDDAKPLRAALLAGLFAGLAAATKYSMALAILPLFVACVMRRGPLTPNNGGTGGGKDPPSLSGSPIIGGEGGLLALGLLAFVFAFFAACPGALLENSSFLEGLRFEAVHVQNADDPTFRDTGNGFVYHIARNLDAGLGRPLLLLALVSVGYGIYRRERGDSLLAAFALPYYILISLAAVRYARYVIPLLPILALWVGRILADGLRLPRVALQRATAATGTVVVLLTAAETIVLIQPMAAQDPRDQGLQIIAHYPAAKVGFPTMPWFQTVPISPYFSMPRPGGWQGVMPQEKQLRIVYYDKDWDLDALNASKPDIVILSEYDYDDALRRKDPAALRYLQKLRQDYKADYLSIPEAGESILNNFSRVDGWPTRNLPHDMLYPNPIISIYQRKL